MNGESYRSRTASEGGFPSPFLATTFVADGASGVVRSDTLVTSESPRCVSQVWATASGEPIFRHGKCFLSATYYQISDRRLNILTTTFFDDHFRPFEACSLLRGEYSQQSASPVNRNQSIRSRQSGANISLCGAYGRRVGLPH